MTDEFEKSADPATPPDSAVTPVTRVSDADRLADLLVSATQDSPEETVGTDTVGDPGVSDADRLADLLVSVTQDGPEETVGTDTVGDPGVSDADRLAELLVSADQDAQSRTPVTDGLSGIDNLNAAISAVLSETEPSNSAVSPVDALQAPQDEEERPERDTSDEVERVEESAPPLTPDELEIANKAREIYASTEMETIREAQSRGESYEAVIQGVTIVYEPALAASGMTLFGEQGFVLGREAFNSDSELAKTIAHELFRLAESDSAEGVTQELVSRETSAAFDFANRAELIIRR